MNSIIDILKPEFNDVPVTLDGEVLLERTKDEQGNITGYMTAPTSFAISLKDKTDMELKELGWLPFKSIIENI